MSKFNDYEDMYGYDDGPTFTKLKKSNKTKHKGHYSKHGSKKQDFWKNAESEDLQTSFSTFSAPASVPDPIPNPAPAPAASFFAKGVAIELSNISGLKKVDRLHNDQMTYGIKLFYIKGDQQFRIIWFGPQQQERDCTYNDWYVRWSSLTNKGAKNYGC